MKILDYADKTFRSKLSRILAASSHAQSVGSVVAAILEDVRLRGDAALAEYTQRFDGAPLAGRAMCVPARELAQAMKQLAPADRMAIREAVHQVTDFHRHTLPKRWRAKNPHGAIIGENFYPVRRVGLYIPGGQVPLVSTVIMTAIPARLAKVQDIAVCTPPRPDGTVDVALLAALHACGITEVYRVGGAQAIGALAFGTATIPAVDVIAGPGNAYVTEAQRQVFGRVGVRLLPGPSEVMVLGDTSASPRWMAAELLAQAEHGTGKERVYLGVLGRQRIEAVNKELEIQLRTLKRAAPIRRVLKEGYYAIHAETLDALVEVANLIAPEHLQLMVQRGIQERVAARLTTAGAILLGHETPTVLGDFVAGPSHTLPTGTTGRFFSGLQAVDFLRRTSIVGYERKSLLKARATVAAFSRMEQLDAHGRSLEWRLEGADS